MVGNITASWLTHAQRGSFEIYFRDYKFLVKRAGRERKEE